MEDNKRKVDIYSLYKREKKITLEDDEGNFVDLLLVKMTQGQRAQLLREYSDFLEQKRQELRLREEKFNTFASALASSVKEDFIMGIIAFEHAQRTEIADLYPALDGKEEEEKAKILKEEFKKFEENRKKQLLEKSDEELKKQFIDLSIDAQALIESARILNFRSLVYMCLDVETREPIFKNGIDSVENITDRRVLDELLKQMLEFRTLETAKEVRKIASSDESFLPAGELQKSSTDSPVTTV